MDTSNCFHFYDFHNSRVIICVKATDLADAIDELRDIYGEDWVSSNVDSLDINWYKPNHK